MNRPFYMALLIGIANTAVVLGQTSAVAEPKEGLVVEGTRPGDQQNSAVGNSQELKIVETEGAVRFRSPWLRLGVSRGRARISELCWDSLGEGKLDFNLVKSGAEAGPTIVTATSGQTAPNVKEFSHDGNVVRYELDFGQGIHARWEIRVEAKSVDSVVTWQSDKLVLLKQPPALCVVFNLDKTVVASLASPKPGVAAPLPLLLHAADQGTVSVSSQDETPVQLRAEPRRKESVWKATIGTWPPTDSSPSHPFVLHGGLRRHLRLSVERIMPLPHVSGGDPQLKTMPRHWLNAFQYRPEIGILSNNVVSDNAVICMYTFTIPAAWTPPLPGGVEAIDMARESLDRYFAGAPGYLMGTCLGQDCFDVVLETRPALLRAAWAVIRTTGDMQLLARWLPKLEELGLKLEARDTDGNGLPESTLTGLRSKKNSCPRSNWFDQINFGHEDAFSCALAYQAFLELADLERLAGRDDMAERFRKAARRLRDAYVKNFYNPETDIIAGWKDVKGELHDYWFVFVNGAAITFGLVEDDLANKIVDRIEAKFREVGYDRFELGLPGNLAPIPTDDYGANTLGTGSFQTFENGGATACYAYYYVQALYQLGRRQEAERILRPMMKTYAKGGYQNGLLHGGAWTEYRAPSGGEWTRWDGAPSGYEGFLADAYFTQLAVFTGRYGIAFGPQGFYLQPWSPLKGRQVKLGLKYMGRVVDRVE